MFISVDTYTVTANGVEATVVYDVLHLKWRCHIRQYLKNGKIRHSSSPISLVLCKRRTLASCILYSTVKVRATSIKAAINGDGTTFIENWQK